MEIKTLFPADTEFLTLPEPTGKRQHYTRSQWPAGPWHKEEYDKIVWVDPATNLDCMLARGPMGSWCGYVGVPEGHPWHGVEYSGCISRHPPETPEEKLQNAREWVEAAERTGTGLEVAKMTLEALESPEDNWTKRHNTWPCLDYQREDRCSSPESQVSVHGGLTYSGECQGTICHVAKEGRPKHVWWFGFDTAHSMDLVPGMLASSAYMREKLKDDPKDNDLFREHLEYDPETGTNYKYGDMQSYKGVPYCKGQVEKMAEQLRDIHLAVVGMPT